MRGLDTVCDGREAVDRAVAFEAGVVLLDVDLRASPAASVLECLRGDFRTALTPVVCVTSVREPSRLVLLLEAGADDYVAKPFKADELEARILSAVRRRAAMSAANPLTGLPGNVVLTAATQQRLCDGDLFALLLVDIDGFKAYNEHYGFVRGDAAISALGRLLRTTLEEVGVSDCVLAHLAGDDFAILTSAEQAEPTALAVVAAFDRAVTELYDPVDVERGHVLTTDRRGETRSHALLSVSIGIATTRNRTFASASAMADIAIEVQGVAKREIGSAFVVDRRRH